MRLKVFNNVRQELLSEDTKTETVREGRSFARRHTLMRKSRPSEAGMCSVSRLRADGVYGKRTGKVCLVSSRS